jgi:hypothetical protein
MPSSRRPSPGAASSDPFAGVERVYVDGSNLLHALARDSRSGEPGPAGAVIGRLRAAFPAEVLVDLVFDGPPSGGVTGRLATGLRVSYSGRISADRVIDDGVAAQLAADGPGGTWGILVVTDDRGLQATVRAKGARTASTAWLAGRIGRLAVDRPQPGDGARAAGRDPGSRSRRREAPGTPLPKAGTAFGHRRPPRAAPRDDG